ncbi:hypothetical protein [Streptomyces sp. NPDC058697]
MGGPLRPILNSAQAGNVTLANTAGNGVTDGKLLYTYVPDLIRLPPVRGTGALLCRVAPPRRARTVGGGPRPARPARPARREAS